MDRLELDNIQGQPLTNHCTNWLPQRWRSLGKKFIEFFCQYPEGFLEAQAKKEEEKKKQQKDKEQDKESEKGKGKGKGKRKRDEGYCCILLLITLTILKCNLRNPLSPNSDQQQFSPNNIHTLS